MRRLDLHVSALNNDEYELYTSSLADITLDDDRTLHDDQYYEQLSIGVREVRAWLRGRYSQLSAATIDTIVKFFSPNLAQSDSLSGGQFFAALRLVVHAQSGKPVDRSLAFVQAHPVISKFPSDSIELVVSGHDPVQPTTAPPNRRNGANNPFVARSKSFSSSRSEDSPAQLPPLPPRKPSIVPAPPPRHASLLSHAAMPPTVSSVKSIPIPAPLLRATSGHMTSTLMKQSLQASKAGQTMKKAEEQLEKERIMQVLKRSSPAGSTSRDRSKSPIKHSAASSHSSDEAPPLPRRKPKHPSPPLSNGSLERVALANTPFSESPFKSPVSKSPQTSPSHEAIDLPNGPPPKHPDRRFFTHQRATSFGHPLVTEPESLEPKAFTTPPGSASPHVTNFESSESPSTRIVRSKSLHHPSPPNSLPLPPPRRKRPESFQTPSPVSSIFSDDHQNHRYHQRQPSGSAQESPLSNIQRTLATLQPKLDKARYKAEAGLSRRGFVRDGHTTKGVEGEEEEGLMHLQDVDGVFDDKYAVGDQLTGSSTKADLWDDDDKDSWVGHDKDKWPISAGWKPL